MSGLDFAFCYLDGILIGNSSPDEHLLHLQLELQLLQQYRLVLNMEKCEIGRTGINFWATIFQLKGPLPSPDM